MGKVLVGIPVSSEPYFLVEWAVQFWKKVGIPHFFSIDSKFEGEKVPLFEKLRSRNFSIFPSTGLTIEAGYQEFCNSIPSDLILRIDIDEVLLNKEYLSMCEALLQRSPDSIIGIPRVQAVLGSSGLGRCVDSEFSPLEHIQWRGFDKTRAEWDITVHTPGFKVQEDRKVPLPDLNSFIHLNWVFLNQQQLLEKSRRYDLAGQSIVNRVQHTFQVHSATSEELLRTPVRLKVRRHLRALRRINLEP